MDLVTSKPSDEPASGPAVEQPPNPGAWRPTVTVYERRHEPMLWIYLASGWTLATVRAKHEYASGLVVVDVELAMPNEDGTTSTFSRSYAWGKDNVRPVDPET